MSRDTPGPEHRGGGTESARASDRLSTGQQARRDRIVAAALHRLLDGEFDDIKVTEIAEEANVALGTLYRYFVSKEHLFAAVFAQWQGQLTERVQSRPLRGSTDHERTLDLVERMVKAFQTYPQLYRLLLVLQVTDDVRAREVYDELGAAFQHPFEAALVDAAEPDRAAITRTIAAIIDTSLRSWATGRITLAEARRFIIETVDLVFLYPAQGVGPVRPASRAKRP